MSGIMYLNSCLKEEIESDEQDNEWASLDAYFDLVQGSSSIENFTSTHEMAFSDAQTRAKLSMSDAGRTFVLSRAANLSSNQIADIRMRVGGDLSKFKEIKQSLTKIHGSQSGSQSEAKSSTLLQMANQHYAETWRYLACRLMVLLGMTLSGKVRLEPTTVAGSR